MTTRELEKFNMFSRSAKAIVAFVLSFGAFLTATLANQDIANGLPDGWLKWLTVVGVPAVIGLGTWLVRNVPTVAEAEKLLADARARLGR